MQDEDIDDTEQGFMGDAETSRKSCWADEFRFIHNQPWMTAEGRRNMPYDKFLQTKYWYQVKRIVLGRDRYTCQQCGLADLTGKYLDVHHLTYEYRGNELHHLNDVTTLCHRCCSMERTTPTNRRQDGLCHIEGSLIEVLSEALEISEQQGVREGRTEL